MFRVRGLEQAIMELRQFSSQKLRSFIHEIDQTFVEEYGRGGDVNYGSFRREVKARCLLDGVTEDIYSRIRHNIKHDADLTWDELVEGVQDAEWLWSLCHRKSRFVGTRTRSHNDGNFKIDADGYVVVYTDGACIRNGQPDAQAGIGVWFGPHHKLNVSKPLEFSSDPVTNNVAEIKAVIKAFEIVKNRGVERLAIFTDSKYLIDSISDWIFGWLSNDWRKSDGGRVKHKKQYRELLMAMEDMDIKWIHVKGHSNDIGNIEADHLARRGAQKYENLSDED